MSDINWLAIGKLTKPNGLKGDIRMFYFGDDPLSLGKGTALRVIKGDGLSVELVIQRIRASKNALILKFSGFDSIDDVKNLSGGVVHIDKAVLKQPNEDEYFWNDLIGMLVYDEKNELLGTLENIFTTGSNDVFVITKEKNELLLPAIKDVIKTVDVKNKVMHVHLLEGMRDDL